MQQLQWALTGGDDYELCFSVSPEKKNQIKALSDSLELPLTEIGRVENGAGVQCIDNCGQNIAFEKSGYQHFHSEKLIKACGDL